MQSDLKVITPPTDEPVSLAEAKRHLRIRHADEDPDISVYIASARDYFENRTGRTIHQTTYEIAFDCWPVGKMELPRATPLISVTSVLYTDSDGNETTWPAASYDLDTYNNPGHLMPAYGEDWPSFTPRVTNPIIVRYVAGIANAAPLTEAPASIRAANLLLIAALFENREAEVVGDRLITTVAPIVAGVDAFLAPHVVDYEC